MLDFLFKGKRRAALAAEGLTAEQRALVLRNVPYVASLPEEDRRELWGHVRVLLEEKTFEGCGGLELTDEIKLSIAAQAGVLLLHRETDYYPGVESILVYPSTYVVRNTRQMLGDTVLEADQRRIGESWVRGVVVLAWDAVRSGAANAHDGHNVVFHEFAHQLDAEGRPPALREGATYGVWARALAAEYEELVRQVHAHRHTDLDAYGATNPAEFFAVATEAFFETGAALRERRPALYDALRTFYGQDPAAVNP